VLARPAQVTSRTLRGLGRLSPLTIRTPPTALMRPVNASRIPRVILAQSSLAAIILSLRDDVASVRILFEQASAGISFWGTVRFYLAGVRRYTPYIDAARTFQLLSDVRALPSDSA
jgi:hypothetical protein